MIDNPWSTVSKIEMLANVSDSGEPCSMGEKLGTRAFARFLAFAVAATVMMAGLTAPPPAHAADTPEQSEAELVAALRAYLAPKAGNFSVSVRELDGDLRSVSLNGTKRVEPASTIKLFYAWAALRAIDNGTLTYGTVLSSKMTVLSCLRVMIQVSDNYCAADLRLKLGMTQLNNLFKSEGYLNTYIVLNSQGGYVTKRTSTNDLALLLARLEQGELLSEAQTDKFKTMLLAQIWRQRFSSGVAQSTVVGSKSGQLWVSSGMVEADTAIIYGPNSTYVLTAIGTHGASTSTIRGISTVVYRHLQGEFDTRATFPSQQFVTTSQVYLRKTPGGSLIRLLPQGTAVQVISSTRNSMYVKAGGRYGWVPFHYLKLREAYLWPESG
jgi:beta-lactamase class A